MSATKVIPPGSTLGVFGGGQLGRMFVLAAREMGYRAHVFVPEQDAPASHVADETIVAPYDNLDAVRAFAKRVDVVTFEFENVPAQTAAAAEECTPVRPAGRVLAVAQHRLREKSMLKDAGLPVTPFQAVRSKAELDAALQRLAGPGVLKTAAWGYDGKGQTKVSGPEDAERAWSALQNDELILEQAIDFQCEVSVVAVRGLDGSEAFYGPIENQHRHHILDLSLYPARVDERLQREAVDLARQVVRALDVVGVLCVEFFVTRDGALLINEVAPRPHNSGHLTMDACVSGQFEQQVRAICGLPLGSTRLARPAAMANLLGDLWQAGAPRWERALALPDVRLHLYGKSEARPGRKMGHLTATAEDVDAAARLVLQARDALVAP